MKNLLIIDDQECEHIIFTKKLESYFKVKSAFSIKEALNFKNNFHCVILDYSVINNYGFTFFNKIKKHFKCPIILTSSSFPFMEKKLKEGDFIGKEVLVEHLKNLQL